ncbi:hypothetical protein CU254_32960 [Amycolatopsis sp. AA4]|nr:hypothetical protein CU254_32960 [Amycolatopsis sp. AA4]
MFLTVWKAEICPSAAACANTRFVLIDAEADISGPAEPAASSAVAPCHPVRILSARAAISSIRSVKSRLRSAADLAVSPSDSGPCPPVMCW